VTAGSISAELVERREVLPGQRIATFHAPPIAAAARAGQFLEVLLTDDDGLPVRRPFAIATADPATGAVAIHVETDGRAGPVERLRPGDRAILAGPFGRGFEVDPRSHHLLAVAEAGAVARVRMLIDAAIRDGRQVTLLLGAASARHVYPSTLLPDEVEYIVATADGSLGHAGSVIDLVPAYEAWADQAFAAGSGPFLAALARLAVTRRARMGVARLGRKGGGGRPDPPGSPAARRRAFLQVAAGHEIGCAGATCLGCVVQGAAGNLLRVCREGPAFAAEELEWEAAS
jgi:dihydroorotate dehydrogenase electron transfer subunit